MKKQTILGIKFIAGTAAEAVEAGLHGGLVVVPSAPVLVGIESDPALRAAVLGADLAIADSGLMVLLWWLFKGEKIERVSGLEYLKLLLEKLEFGAGVSERRSNANDQTASDRCQTSVFWVMPTVEARDRNLAWLRGQGFATTEEDCYVAPMYATHGPIFDQQLATIIDQQKPAHIIIALGGGVQERLGFSLREALSAKGEEQGGGVGCGISGSDTNNKQLTTTLILPYRPGLHCIGAAIGFLSGEQVRIPMWVDYIYLGWLWRSVSMPRRFVPRYWKAARLIHMMMRYGAEAPRVRAEAPGEVSA